MIPLNFGIINALKKCPKMFTFSSDPPEEELPQTSHLILNGKNPISRAEPSRNSGLFRTLAK
ncbi:MAG: hypothetical protein LBO73_04850 [Holosporaceae bacterium]|jgi:hypothetical protein|nr:hypothetical protein [Holosporaceae bacterium]